MLEVKNLSKIYGLGEVQVRALDGITFTIADGDMVCIMGKGCSGKSTLPNFVSKLFSFFLVERSPCPIHLSSSSLHLRCSEQIKITTKKRMGINRNIVIKRTVFIANNQSLRKIPKISPQYVI